MYTKKYPSYLKYTLCKPETRWWMIWVFYISWQIIINDILTLDQLQWLTYRPDFSPMSWRYWAWPSPNYKWFPWSIWNGCGMPAGNAYHSGHLVPSLLGQAYDPIAVTSFTEIAVSFFDFWSWISLGTLIFFRFCSSITQTVFDTKWCTGSNAADCI